MAETDQVTVVCPNCGNHLSASRENLGKRARCGRCDKSFILPTESPLVPPPQETIAPRLANPRIARDMQAGRAAPHRYHALELVRQDFDQPAPPDAASMASGRFIKCSFPFHLEDATPAGVWADLQTLAVDELGADALPNLLAATRGRCIYLPASARTLQTASLNDLSLPYASLPGLRSELAKLAPRWDLPFKEGPLRRILRIFGKPKFKDDVRPEALAFAAIVLAANEATRWKCPLWLELDPTRPISDNDQRIVENFLEKINAGLTIKTQGQGGPVSEADQESKEAKPAVVTAAAQAGSYEEAARQLEESKVAFNRTFVANVGEALKTEMLRQGRDATTYETKLELVRWTNAELRRFGVALSTPKTGVGILAAAEGGPGGAGRFQIKGKAKDADGRSSFFLAKDISELIENLAVVEAPPRREALAERIEREAAPPKSRRGR